MCLQGHEYDVLRHVLLSQPAALCSFDVFAVEWHETNIRPGVPRPSRAERPAGLSSTLQNSSALIAAPACRAAGKLPANTTGALTWLLGDPSCHVALISWH